MVLQLLDEMEADGGLSLSTLGAGPLAAAAISVKHGGLGFCDCAVLQREADLVGDLVKISGERHVSERRRDRAEVNNPSLGRLFLRVVRLQ